MCVSQRVGEQSNRLSATPCRVPLEDRAGIKQRKRRRPDAPGQAELERRLAATEAEIVGLKKLVSWRITAPMRWGWTTTPGLVNIDICEYRHSVVVSWGVERVRLLEILSQHFPFARCSLTDAGKRIGLYRRDSMTFSTANSAFKVL
jgi:hypothetical protein